MQIYQALKQDHDQLKSLLRELMLTEHGTYRRREVVEVIKEELVPHSRAEETVLYNTLRCIKSMEMKELVMGHGYGEHIDAENLLSALLKNDPEVDDVAAEFKEALEHHIKEEEDQIFSAARSVLDEREASEMAQVFHELKDEIRSQGDEENLQELVMNMLPERFPENLHHL